MKPDLIACILGRTSNSSALGEENLQIQLAFCPWHAEPGRKLFNLSQQWFPAAQKGWQAVFVHTAGRVVHWEWSKRPSGCGQAAFQNCGIRTLGVFSVSLGGFKLYNFPPGSQDACRCCLLLLVLEGRWNLLKTFSLLGTCVSCVFAQILKGMEKPKNNLKLLKSP